MKGLAMFRQELGQVTEKSRDKHLPHKDAEIAECHGESHTFYTDKGHVSNEFVSSHKLLLNDGYSTAKSYFQRRKISQKQALPKR